MKMNLQKISEVTGFSTATISNALNRKKGVNAETATKIFKTARELGYFTGVRISSIRFVQYKTSGKIVGETPFFSAMIRGLEQECRAMGYEAILTTINQDDDDFTEHLDQVLNDISCGVVLLATEASEQDMVMFSQARAPLLLLDNWPETVECNALLISNTDSACHAVEYLIERGHRKIGYLKSCERIKNFFYRQEGYRRALLLNGLVPDEKFEVALPPETMQAWAAMEEYLSTDPELPTAFFADNDNIALGALKAFEARGIRVPEDVSVIGFDDMPFSKFSTPPLTTISVSKEEMGRLAIRILLDSVNSNLTVRIKTQICTQLIERESVRSI